MSDLIKEIEKRKPSELSLTRMPEKPLYGKVFFSGCNSGSGCGKIQQNKKGATSDFMEIERQRGFLWQLPYWLLNTEITKSTFWILPVTRILQKILTEL
jgi:hypothetical protein